MNFIEFAHLLSNKPLVKQAFTQLHSHPQINSNLLLYALWYGVNQRWRLFQPDIKTLIESIQPWHERILLALKRLPPHPPFIQGELATEINIAEQFEWQLISSSLLKFNFQNRSLKQQLHDTCYNIMNYCKAIRILINEKDHSAIILLLQAAFPNVLISKIIQACETIVHPETEKNRNFSQLSLNEF